MVRVGAQHETVILEGRAAARGGDQDGVERLRRLGPDRDIAAGGLQGLVLAPHVMDDAAAAPLPLRHHHLDAVAGQHADRRVQDRWGDHGRDAAWQERDPRLAGPLRREHLRPLGDAAARQPARRKLQHGGDALEPQSLQQAAEGLGEDRKPQRSAQPGIVGQDGGEQRTHQAVEARPPVALLDHGAGVIDQVHVVHAGGAGGHAGEARQAAVDVGHHLGGRGGLVLQHVLDQVDAPARRIELVAEQHVGRAGGGAEAAMHAGAQDLLRLRDLRVGELGEGEQGLHAGNQ